MTSQIVVQRNLRKTQRNYARFKQSRVKMSDLTGNVLIYLDILSRWWKRSRYRPVYPFDPRKPAVSFSVMVRIICVWQVEQNRYKLPASCRNTANEWRVKSCQSTFNRHEDRLIFPSGLSQHSQPLIEVPFLQMQLFAHTFHSYSNLRWAVVKYYLAWKG